MGAHALGAAAYAVRAVGLAEPDGDARAAELSWQVGHLSEPARCALLLLPPVGSDRSGPLGAGLLATGELGSIIRDLQAAIATS